MIVNATNQESATLEASRFNSVKRTGEQVTRAVIASQPQGYDIKLRVCLTKFMDQIQPILKSYKTTCPTLQVA